MLRVRFSTCIELKQRKDSVASRDCLPFTCIYFLSSASAHRSPENEYSFPSHLRPKRQIVGGCTALRSCDILITGRRLPYARVLQIIQDEEYLHAIDIPIRRRRQVKIDSNNLHLLVVNLWCLHSSEVWGYVDPLKEWCVWDSYVDIFIDLHTQSPKN